MRRGGTQRARGRGRGGISKRGASQSVRLKGLFDKIWYCDCTPRQPAEQFRVKKEGRNKGKLFYTCQQDSDKRCGFFLWADEARLREASCVLNNGQGEEPQEGWSAERPRVHFAGPPTPSPAPALHAGVKRKTEVAGFADQDEDDEAWDLTGAEEAQLAAAADASVHDTPQTPQRGTTPSAGVYATPVSGVKRSPRKLPWLQEDDLKTPKKSIRDFFNAPAKRTRMLSPDDTPVQPDRDSMVVGPEPDSPSPATRFRDSLAPPSSTTTTTTTEREASLTDEVLKELGQMPSEKLIKLKSILRKHEAKAEGLRKGRDVSRAALKTSQTQLLQARDRIASLEAERNSRYGAMGADHNVTRIVDEDDETEDEL